MQNIVKLKINIQDYQFVSALNISCFIIYIVILKYFIFEAIF